MQKFRVIFPQKWDAQYKTTELAALSLQEWALGIQYLTNEQLAIGVEAVRMNCTWPPSIAEFVGLCTPESPNEHWEHKRQKHGYIPRSRRIEKKPDMDKVNAERDKLREMGILKQRDTNG